MTRPLALLVLAVLLAAGAKSPRVCGGYEGL